MEGAGSQPNQSLPLGTLGYLAAFFWSLALILFTPPARLALACGLAFGLAWLLYPAAFWRLLRLRWLLFLMVVSLPVAFWEAGSEETAGRLAFSVSGLETALALFLRALIILVAVQGLASRVNIIEIAGLLERFGLRGLGFSIGVAVNLLPTLLETASHAWHSLWMRGGLRRQRWRGLQLLLLTIGTNTLQRAEEIALAAEARAFTPERSRRLPLKKGRYDRVLILGGLLTLLVIL